MTARALTLMAGLVLAAPAWGFYLDRLQNRSQGDFRLLSEDAGATPSYHPQTPTEPLGITGFDVGLSLTMSKIVNRDAWIRASSESVPTYLAIPTLRAN